MLGAVFMWAIFPIIIKSSENLFAPLFFAGISTLSAGIFLFLILLFKGKTHELFHKRGAYFTAINTLFIALLFLPIVIWAGQKTTAGNTALLLQSEILFTVLFFGVLGIEKVTRQRIFGIAIVLIGVILVLFQDFSGVISQWDLILVIACLLPPVGNFFAKKALKEISTTAVLCFRNLTAGLILTSASILFFEPLPIDAMLSSKGIIFILINSIIIFAVRILLAYEAFKRIDIHKAVALEGISPALALIMAFFFLGEMPNVFQFLGLIAVTIGIMQVAHRVKTPTVQ